LASIVLRVETWTSFWAFGASAFAAGWAAGSVAASRLNGARRVRRRIAGKVSLQQELSGR
jgi:hypothetical protein